MIVQADKKGNGQLGRPARIPREEGSIVSSRDRAPGARASGRTARAISAPGADKTMMGKYRDIEDDDAKWHNDWYGDGHRVVA